MRIQQQRDRQSRAAQAAHALPGSPGFGPGPGTTGGAPRSGPSPRSPTPSPSRLWAITTTAAGLGAPAGRLGLPQVRVGTGDVGWRRRSSSTPRWTRWPTTTGTRCRRHSGWSRGPSRVTGQPIMLDVGTAGVISCSARRARSDGLARALLCQVAVAARPRRRAPRRRHRRVGGDWEWAKWLPHSFEPQTRGEAGVVPLVADCTRTTSPTSCRAELTRRAELQASRAAAWAFDRARRMSSSD